MSSIPSPCIGVCKFRREGHCIGCSMTKGQKSLFKKLKRRRQQATFLELLVNQQSAMGRYSHWLHAYRRRCEKRGLAAPLD